LRTRKKNPALDQCKFEQKGLKGSQMKASIKTAGACLECPRHHRRLKKRSVHRGYEREIFAGVFTHRQLCETSPSIVKAQHTMGHRKNRDTQGDSKISFKVEPSPSELASFSMLRKNKKNLTVRKLGLGGTTYVGAALNRTLKQKNSTPSLESRQKFG